MLAYLGCWEYPVQPGDTEEIPARGELVQPEPIFFHPLPTMHNPLVFLANVRHMQKQRARLEKTREQERQAQWQADARASWIASRIATRAVMADILSKRIEAGDMQA